jgi:hypothetical protein
MEKLSLSQRDMKTRQCHGGSRTWGDLQALFAGSPQVTEAYITVISSASPATVQPVQCESQWLHLQRAQVINLIADHVLVIHQVYRDQQL